MNPDIPLPPVASRDDWLKARLALLEKEKELTRARDALNAERRRLPRVRVEKDYFFEGPAGRVGLANLFEGRDQLIIYHFMLDPDHEEGCDGCSLMADNIPHLSHFHARHTSFALVSRARLATIEAFRRRMGWELPWYSSFDSDFNYDYHVTMDETRGSTEWNYRDSRQLTADGKLPPGVRELPGVSVFLREGGQVFHTYSTYARGLDMLVNTCNFLDLTPFGRGEGWGGMPDLDGLGGNWLRHHDRYGTAPGACHSRRDPTGKAASN
jgi:predicted dithiol-disulfide oxidoreductase (DUF899 family)